MSYVVITPKHESGLSLTPISYNIEKIGKVAKLTQEENGYIEYISNSIEGILGFLNKKQSRVIFFTEK